MTDAVRHTFFCTKHDGFELVCNHKDFRFFAVSKSVWDVIHFFRAWRDDFLTFEHDSSYTILLS